MEYLLSSAQMKDLDRRTIEDFGLPSRLLMEIAGKGCADVIFDYFTGQIEDGVCVLCGSGNNGGDGAVIARWLHNYGCEVSLLRFGSGQVSPETQANLDLCAALGIPVLRITRQSDLQLAEEQLRASGLVVDAIFGIGFKYQPDKWLRQVFDTVNTAAACIVAVDIPSGLDADTGFCVDAIYADATLCIANYKLGHLLGYGREACGELLLVDLGIPPAFYDDLPAALLFEEQDFRPPLRGAHFHKNDYGKVYIIGGVPGYTGATVLAAQAALRAGCGYAFLLHRPELAPLYAAKLTEALCQPIAQGKNDLPDARALLRQVAEADAVLIGPGLGRDAYALKLLEILLKQVKIPLVLDADALNLLAEQPELLSLISRPNVLLTPHWGEFARLAAIDKEDLERDCLTPLKRFVAEHQARVLLKSHFSVYHDPRRTLVNISGNDGLATGGSGDVLAGIIASFLAQGLEIPDAAINASYLLGHTAEILAHSRQTPSILPSDIIAALFVQESDLEV